MTAQGVRVMPVRWALVFATVSALALGGPVYIAGTLVGRAQETPAVDPDRLYLDWKRVPVRDAEVYSVRWLQYGQVHTVDVEGGAARDALVAWLRR